MCCLGNKEVFAKNLKYYMSLHNIDRNQLCVALGFKYTTVSEWLAGNKYPRIDKIEMLANYFGIQKSNLIEENNTTQKCINKITVYTMNGDKPVDSIEFNEENIEEISELVSIANQLPKEKVKALINTANAMK